MDNTLHQRFIEKVEKTDSCWTWKAGLSKKGYGRLMKRNKDGVPEMRLAHRISYELFVGPIPNGLLICHHCDNPSCVNPNHLFCGTHLDNIRDMMRKGRENMRGSPVGTQQGERNVGAKLTEKSVQEIRKTFDPKKGVTICFLADKFNVNYRTIWQVVKRKRWNHI